MKYITFWGRYSQEDKSLEEWKNKEIHLTELSKLSFLSHSRIQNEVILYTYQKIADKLPYNVVIKDASEMLDSEMAYDFIKRGQRMCHVADVVRLKHAAKYTGIIIDVDTVVLRPFPDKGFICSMPAKLTGGFAPQWGIAHPPLKIVDNSWDGKALIDFPVSVDNDMRYHMNNIAVILEHRLKGEPIKGFDGWNEICRVLEAIPHVDNRYKILSSFYTCPVPPWRGGNKCYSLESPTRFDGRTKMFGHRMPSVEEILDNSLAVQHFFESSFRGEYRTEKGFWESVKEGSLLAREAEYVLGIDWRNILNESHHVLE